jgi:hypothetical protein
LPMLDRHRVALKSMLAVKRYNHKTSALPKD